MAEKKFHNAATNWLMFIFFFGVSTCFFIDWIPSHSSQIPAFEEGLLDVSAVQYSARYLRANHRLPQLWENRTYSQSLDEQYYQATLVELPATLIAVVFPVDAIHAVALCHLFLTTVILIIIYLTLRYFGLEVISSAAGALIYLATNSYYLTGISQGNMRLLLILTGLTMLVYFAMLYAARKKVSPVRRLLLFLGIALGSTIIGQGNLSLLPQALLFIIVLPLALRNSIDINLKKLIVVGLIVIAVSAFCFIQIQKAKALDPDPVASSLLFNEAPNLFTAFNLSIGNPSRPPLEVQNFNLTWRTEALAATVLVVSIIGLMLQADLCVLGLWIICYAALTAGPNGPLAQYMNLIPYFRSAGRTFFLFLHYGIIILFTCSLDMLFKRIGNRSIARTAIGILLAILLFPALLVERNKLVRTRQIEPGLEEAYRSIPNGSTISLLPQYLGGSSYSDNAENYALYRHDFAVGLSLMHQHEYLSEKYNLQNTTSPPNDWTIPLLTRNNFAYLEKSIEKGRWAEIRKQLSYLNPDLGYLIIYTKIIHPKVTQGFQSIGWALHFQNDLATVLKSREQDLSKISSYQNALSTFSDNYGTGFSSIASLPHDAARKNLFINSDKNLTTIPITDNDSLPVLLNNYEPDNLIYDTIYRESRIGKHLKVSCDYCGKTDFYQPSINKNMLMASSRPIELSGMFPGPKSCLIRVFNKRGDISRLNIAADNRPVAFRKIGQNNNFFYLKTDLTNAEKLSVSHRDPQSTDVDGLNVIYIDVAFCATQSELDVETTRLQNLFRAKYDFLSILEPENRSEGTGAAIICGNLIDQSLSRNEALCSPSDLYVRVIPEWLRKDKKINIYLVTNTRFAYSRKGELAQKGGSTGEFQLSVFDQDVLEADGSITLKSKGGFCIDAIYASSRDLEHIVSLKPAAPVDVAGKDWQSLLLHCSGNSIIFRNSYSPNWSFNGHRALITNFFQNGQTGLTCPVELNYQEELFSSKASGGSLPEKKYAHP
jgi:hypothetical protein